MATWSSADQTCPAQGVWTGKPIAAMARDVRRANDQAGTGAAGVASIVPAAPLVLPRPMAPERCAPSR